MQAWLESCEDWLVTQYKEILGLDLGGDEARFAMVVNRFPDGRM